METLARTQVSGASTTEAAQRRNGPERIPSLDGLRAASILLVLFAHALGTNGFPHTKFLDRFAAIGILGVQVFFVISGYLITRLLIREKYRTGGISLKRFYIRRGLRILPVFYTFLLVITVLKLTGRLDLATRDLAAAFLYVVNFLPHPAWDTGHIWSLSVEEQFYLLWPLAVKKFPNEICVKLAIATAILVPVSRCIVFYYDPSGQSAAALISPQFGDVLALGCLAAMLLPRFSQDRAFLSFLRSPVVFLTIPIMVLLNGLRLRPDRVPMWLALPAGQAIIAVCAALLLARVITFPEHWTGRLLNWKPLSAIGVLSYSIYLWQQPFLNAERHLRWNAFPLNLLCALTAAIASYFLLERPFLSMRRRWT